jgi:hypothetical protein
MKILTGVLLVLALAVPALAEDETLIGDDIESGGYGAVIVKYGRIMGTDGVFVGGQGGWIINHTLVIGGGGFGLANKIALEGYECQYLGFGYGGLLLEYIIASQKLVHLDIQCLIGAGGVSSYTSYTDDCSYWSEDYYGDGDAFFAMEPGASLILNLHRYVRVGVGATYRYVGGVCYKGLDDSDLRGFTGQMVFKFGTF